MLESEKEGSQFPHMIRMKMGDHEMGGVPPSQTQPGHGPKRPRSAVHEEAGSPDLDPVGRWPPLGVRDQGPGTHHPHSHGQ